MPAVLAMLFGCTAALHHQRRREALLAMNDDGDIVLGQVSVALIKQGRHAQTLQALPSDPSSSDEASPPDDVSQHGIAAGVSGHFTAFVDTLSDGTVGVSAFMAPPPLGRRFRFLLLQPRPGRRFVLIDDPQGRTWAEVKTEN